MNIDIIKQKLRDKTGRLLSFRYNGSRNQIEEFSGTINNMYNYIFTIKVYNSNIKIKSFSYSDLLTKTLEIL